MAFSISKDFCLWVLSIGDGQLRKLRFTLVRVSIIAMLLVKLVFCMMLVLGDYS